MILYKTQEKRVILFDVNKIGKTNSNLSFTRFMIMAGFFSNKQYATIADKELAIKLLKERKFPVKYVLQNKIN